MPTKKFLLSAAAYLVVTFVIAAGWHLALFKDMYTELHIFTRKEPLIYLGLISMVLQSVVVVYLYPRVRGDRAPLNEGLRFGILMGVFMGSSAVFGEAGKQEVSSLSTWLVLESVYYLFQFSVIGIVVGLIYGRKQVRSG